jgi:hypothetical protein
LTDEPLGVGDLISEIKRNAPKKLDFPELFMPVKIVMGAILTSVAHLKARKFSRLMKKVIRRAFKTVLEACS